VCIFLTVYKHVCTYRGIAATTVRQRHLNHSECWAVKATTFILGETWRIVGAKRRGEGSRKRMAIKVDVNVCVVPARCLTLDMGKGITVRLRSSLSPIPFSSNVFVNRYKPIKTAQAICVRRRHKSPSLCLWRVFRGMVSGGGVALSTSEF
jgi:hypothetical protein